jgi:hypothetical protein
MYHYTRDAQDRFVQAFNLLSASKNVTLDDAKLEASFLVLGDLPIESVETAARALAQEASPWMPSDGEWYQRADTEAAAALVLNADREVARLPAAAHIEASEVAALDAARLGFIAAYERRAQRTLPDDHPWKTGQDRVPAYHCARCSDTGWCRLECVGEDPCPSCVLRGRHLYDHDYVAHCVCFGTNKALLAARAHAQQSHRLRHNTTGARQR